MPERNLKRKRAEAEAEGRATRGRGQGNFQGLLGDRERNLGRIRRREQNPGKVREESRSNSGRIREEFGGIRREFRRESRRDFGGLRG